MRKAKALFASALLLSLSACNFTFGGDMTWEYEGEDFEASLGIYRGFFKDTFENTNMTVVLDATTWRTTEYILGTTSHLVDDYSESWAFIQEDGTKIMAASMIEDESEEPYRYYARGEEFYQNSYKSFISDISFLEGIDMMIKDNDLDSEELEEFNRRTFHAKEEGKGLFTESGETDTESALNITSILKAEDGKEIDRIVLDAKAKDGLVTDVTYENKFIDDEGEEEIIRWVLKFTYDNVSKIDIPDISTWTDITEDLLD